MSHLFFETEEQLQSKTHHLVPSVRPKAGRPAVRRHNRWPVACAFTLIDEADIPMTSVNISPFGAFLTSEHELDPEHEVLDLEFTSPLSDEPVRVSGRVIRFVGPVDLDRDACGVAIEFLDVTQAQRRELYHLTHKAHDGRQPLLRTA